MENISHKKTFEDQKKEILKKIEPLEKQLNSEAIQIDLEKIGKINKQIENLEKEIKKLEEKEINRLDKEIDKIESKPKIENLSEEEIQKKTTPLLVKLEKIEGYGPLETAQREYIKAVLENMGVNLE